VTFPELAAVLARCAADGIIDQTRVVTLHVNDEEDQHHAGGGCLGVRRTRDYTLGALVKTPPLSWCDCGGWLATRAGIVLQQAAAEYRIIDLEESNWVASNWYELDRELRTHERVRLGAGRLNNEDGIEQLILRGKQAAESLLERHLSLHGTGELEEMLAAQGVVVAINPQDADHLASWAKRMRIDQERRNHEPLYASATTKALESGETRILAAKRDSETPWTRAAGIPRELGILLWHLHRDETRVVINVKSAVADGVSALARHRPNPSLAVARQGESRPAIVETLRTLWFDGPEQWTDIDEALDAARKL